MLNTNCPSVSGTSTTPIERIVAAGVPPVGTIFTFRWSWADIEKAWAAFVSLQLVVPELTVQVRLVGEPVSITVITQLVLPPGSTVDFTYKSRTVPLVGMMSRVL